MVESKQKPVVEGLPSPFPNVTLNIRYATQDDYEQITDFLENDMRFREPLSATNYDKNFTKSQLLKTLVDRSIDSSLSLLLVSSEGELAGIRLSSILTLPEKRNINELELLSDYKDYIDQQNVDHRHEKRMLALINLLMEQTVRAVPKEVKKCLCMEFLGIKAKFKGGQRAELLNRELIKVALSKGFDYCQVLCTARATQHLCTKIGMKLVAEIYYDKFRENGEICFQNTPDGSDHAALFVANMHELKI